ncbi:MAG: hypothetical protein ACJ71U_19790 [Terriglobales bacterium]
MPEKKSAATINWTTVEHVDLSEQLLELEERLAILRARLDEIEKAKGVSQKILNLEFCF